ncbi:MAG TPA: conjugal transfer protein TraR [Kosmotogaceae bacterium]|nr:MAG: Na+/Ca+ antiporter, CaCA family [Thermotogales bacterium 46_20]HAA85323.1 conjugal transfer protein TraR [Kosmotogaceae bacterium]
MLINLLMLVAGLAALVKGADLLVDGAVKISRRSGLSELFIGLTIVAFGTSVPELAVSISAAVKDSGIAIGNAIGSNIANVALVLGMGALILPVKVKGSSLAYEIPFVILSSIVASALLLGRDSGLLRSDGIVLLCFFVIYIAYVGRMALSDRFQYSEQRIQEQAAGDRGIIGPILLTSVGIVGVIIGSELVVRSGTDIALFLGISETLVGLTVVAIGTSLPELVTTITAAVKKSGALALGNILGSNVINLLLVLGLASAISPIQADRGIAVELVFMIGLIVLLIPLSIRNRSLGRLSGALLLGIYITFVVFGIAAG